MDLLSLLLTLSIERKFDLMLRNIQEFKGKNLMKIKQSDVENFLSTQSSETHSLLFLHITEGMSWSALTKYLYLFLTNFDADQILYATKKFFDCIENFIKYFTENNISAKILKPLLKTIEKLEFLGLTPLHNLYLQVCLRSKMYKEGLKLANKPLAFLSKKSCNS